MKFSREFYFRASFFSRILFSRSPIYLIFAQRQKKVWFYQTETSQMLVFCWYLVRERKKNQNMSFKYRAILFSRTFSCANHSNSRIIYSRRSTENKTHAKIS